MHIKWMVATQEACLGAEIQIKYSITHIFMVTMVTLITSCTTGATCNHILARKLKSAS